MIECVLLQMALSNSSAYMGNTIPVVANGEHVNWPTFLADEEKAKLDCSLPPASHCFSGGAQES